MSSLVMKALKDGSLVSEEIFLTTTMNLKEATKESPVALYDLEKKCKDPSYIIVSNPFGYANSTTILKEWRLIDERGIVDEVVRQIVLNSTEGEGRFLKLVNPLHRSGITVVETRDK